MSRANPFHQVNDGGTCTCAACGRMFSGLRGFDLHKITTTGQSGYDPEYDFRCATDAELVGRGWRQDAHGRWTNSPPMDQEAVSRFPVGARTDADPVSVAGYQGSA